MKVLITQVPVRVREWSAGGGKRGYGWRGGGLLEGMVETGDGERDRRGGRELG